MKVLGFLVLFALAICVVKGDFIIDAFNNNGTKESLSVLPSQIFGTSQYAPFVQHSFNNVTNVTVDIYPNLYIAQTYTGLTGILGGARRIVIATTTSSLTYTPTTGASTYITRNQFNVAYGADLGGFTYLDYFGNYQPDLSNCSFPYSNLCAQQVNVGNLLPNAYDITENGLDQAFAFTVVYADQVGTQFNFYIYSNLTAISTRFVRTTANKRDMVDGFDEEEGYYSYEVKLAQPVILANGKRATTGRRYVLPFSTWSRLPTALTLADYTSVRGLQFVATNIIAIDFIISDFRTVPLISGVKQAVINELVVADRIAEPNEIINYTITINVVQGIDVPITNIFFYDNPTKFLSYATFLPNTVTLQSFIFSQVNCSQNDSSTCVDVYTQDPTNFGAVVLNGSNDPAFTNRIAIFFPAITTGSFILVNFSMSVPPLPCQLQTCSSNCTGPSNQVSITGGCYCQINQGRVCYNIQRNNTGMVASQLDASNDTSSFVAGCTATSDATNTTSYLTVTPIGTLPNPALTIAANPTEKANGVFPCGAVQYTVTLTNNATRSSDSFVVNLTPDTNTVCFTGPNSTNPLFYQDATTGNPVYPVTGGLQYGQTLQFTINCNASCSVSCGVNVTTMAAAIFFGPNTTNCPETTTADDFGSDFVPLIGAPSITLSKANATTINYGSGNATNIASFLISYSNAGQRPATGVVITETVPAALAPYYVSTDNPSFQSAGGNTYTLNLNLTAGQSGSVNFNLRAPATLNDCTTGFFVNTVSSSAVCGGSALTATAYVGVNAVPDLAVFISNVSTSVQPGATVCYNVQYQNIGYRVGQSVVLSINLPTYTAFSASGSAAWVQSGSSSVYTLSVGDVAALSSLASAQFCVVANSNTGCGSFFSTNVNVTSVCAGFPETNFANNYATSVTTSISGTVSLSLSKTAVASANTGSTVVYSITGSNSGTSQAQNVTIVENLPSGVTLGANSGFVAGSTGTYSYFVGTVNAGASFGPYNFSVVLPSSVACPASNVSNTVTVSETCTGATATATAVVSINAAPTLTMTASNVTTIDLTQTTQTCVYACYGNTGTQTANSAVMTLNYGTSPYLTPVTGSNNGWTQSGTGVLSFAVGNINVGTNTCSPSACFTVATPIPCGVNNFNFTFSLTSPCAPGQTVVSSTTTNVVANPNFYISKTNNIAGTASPGANVVYTITFGNSGVRIADNTVLTENLPALFTPGTNNGWNCAAGSSSCTYNVGSLSSSAGQQTVTFVGQLSTNVPGQTVINNTVTISSPQPCSSTASSSSTLAVAGYPNLIISKTDGGISITPGDMIMYTITYSNVGDTAAQNVYVYDTVPAFTVFNRTLSASGWSCADGVGAGTICNYFVGPVNPGQSGTLSFVVKSDDWIRCGTNYTENFVYINTTTQESNYNDNNATDSTPIYGEPDLVIMKMTNRTMSRADRAGPGDLITYNITYSNIGVRDATNAVIYETVPAYTTFVAAASSSQWNCADGSPAGTVCTIAFNSTMYPIMPGMMTMGSMGELTFTVRVESALPPDAHITTNCVSINNTCGECNPYDNMACYTVNLFGVPDLVLNQSAICRSVHWYLEWQNVGDQGASNVVLTDSVPAGTSFDAAASDSRWSCSSSAAGGQCTLNVGDVASGAGGSAVFVTSPQIGTTLDMFTNSGCAQGTGRNPDPTPDNNCDTATVGFSGCPDTCDSCCPVANECCPDKTEVLFNFRGILQGIDSCSAGSSSS